MNLIGEECKALYINKADEVKSKHIWYYNTEFKDFFLSDIFVWSSIKANGYVIEVEGKQAIIPEHYFVAVGDYDVGFDSIQMAEIMGREFDVFTTSINFEEDSWLLKPMRIVGYEEDYEFYYPFFDHIFPVAIGDLAIVVSNKDMYNRLKRLKFDDFV